MPLYRCAADHLVQIDRRADGQPLSRVVDDLTHAVQALDINQVLLLPEAVAHTHEDIGAAHEGTGFALVFQEKVARFF